MEKPKKLARFGLILGPLIALSIILWGNLEPEKPEITYTFAIALLMAIWWVTEAVPLAITALLPIFLFPMFGIMDGKDTASTYINHVIFLFIGGFIIALAMQKWNLHRRIALKILLITGSSPSRILFGFMFATAFLSMWISNTATAMLMIPIVLSIIQELEKNVGKENIRKYTIGLLLGIAYSASIGGIATLVGTPPNLSFARIFQIYFPDAPEINFAMWFVFALPVSVIFFLIVWGYLYLLFKPVKGSWKEVKADTLKIQYLKLGPPSFEEKAVFYAFIAVALLWLTRSEITIGTIIFPGWSNIFNSPKFINDGSIAIFVAVILFMIPSKHDKTGRLMDWETASRLPWNIVLLFGGGFALATGFKESGLSLWFGEQLSWVAQAHPIVIIFTISIMMTFLTELTSNTATTEMILPVLAGLSLSIDINPLFLMLPATLSASMAFMLPVATPPNAIIFGTNKIRMLDMAKTGLILNILGAVVITLAVYFWGAHIFDLDIQNLPSWANMNK